MSSITDLNINFSNFNPYDRTTWPRNQVYESLTVKSLNYIAPKVIIANTAIANDAGPLGPHGDTITEKYLIITDASGKDKENRSPDHIKEDYFTTLTNMTGISPPNNPPLLSFDASYKVALQNLSSSTLTIAWVLYPNGLPTTPPLPIDHTNKPRWVLCTLHRPLTFTQTTPTVIIKPLYLPLYITTLPNITYQSLGAVSMPPCTPNLNGTFVIKDTRMGMIIQSPNMTPLPPTGEEINPEYTIAFGLDREEIRFTTLASLLVPPKSLTMMTTPPRSTRQNPTNPTWLYETNNMSYSSSHQLLSSVPFSTLIHKPSPHPTPTTLTSIVFHIATQNGTIPSLDQPLGPLINPPPIILPSHQSVKAQLLWAQKLNSDYDSIEWLNWCSIANIPPGRITTPPNTNFRQYTLALAIHVGRLNSKDLEWRTNGDPTVCSCLTSAHQPTEESPPDRILTCSGTPSQPNQVGMHDTHNRNIWKLVTQKWHNAIIRPTPTFTRFYCLCGLHYPDPTSRNRHCDLAAIDGRTHGPFFDDLDSASGSWTLIDRMKLKVMATGSFRLKIPSIVKPSSSWAEGLSVLIVHSKVVCANSDSPCYIPSGSSILTVSDSQATIDNIKSKVLSIPKLSEESRAPMASISATMRALHISPQAQKFIWTYLQDNNEHNLTILSDEFYDLFKKINKIVDSGAGNARIFRPDGPFDYGAAADARASPPANGFGHAIFWTRAGLNTGDSPLAAIETALISSHLHHLSHGEALGTVARHILAGRIDPAASPIARELLSPELEDSATRFLLLRSKATQNSVAHQLQADTLNHFPIALKACNTPTKRLCLLCNREIKDNYLHMWDCSHPMTQTGFCLTDLHTSEAVGRISPYCRFPPRKPQPPPRLLTPITPQYPTTLHSLLNAMANTVPEHYDHAKGRALLASQSLTAEEYLRLERLIEHRSAQRGITYYKYARGRGDGRLFGDLSSMQQLKSITRARIGDALYDIDFDCSHPSIIIDLCNKQNIPVPEIINTMVTDREVIRQELSVHYFGSITQEGIKFGKQQTNAFLYGQRLSTMSQFIENKVPEQSHPQKIKQFSEAMDILVQGSYNVPSIIPSADIDATKRRDPSKQGLRLLYAALSDLAARVESIKLHCILGRLSTHWGVDCNGTILMHDGAMISMSDLHPTGEAVLLSKTSLDQEILRDLTNYCRNTLKAYCKLSVKSGSQATDLTCGVPWPILDNHPIPQPNPTNRNYIGGAPDLISLDRIEPHYKNSPSTRTSFIGPTMTIEYKPPQSLTYTHQLKLSLWRALPLIICHSGTPSTLFSSIKNLL